MSKYLACLRCLIPPGPEATVKQIFRWRCVIASTAVLALLGVFVIFGALERIGMSGFARADDVDQKIQKALQPVNLRLTSIETSQSTQGLYIVRLVKSDIAQDIHAEKRAWCRADTSQEKQRLREKLDELHQEYEKVAGTGKYATEPDCKDV